MEDFVTYKQAIKLKELGFDWECNHYYEEGKLCEGFVDEDEDPDFNPDYPTAYGNYNFMEQTFSAPTLSQVQKWLRETKRIHLWIEPERNEFLEEIMYVFYILDENRWIYPAIEGEKCYNTYEEALSEGINKAIEFLKEQ